MRPKSIPYSIYQTISMSPITSASVCVLTVRRLLQQPLQEMTVAQGKGAV